MDVTTMLMMSAAFIRSAYRTMVISKPTRKIHCEEFHYRPEAYWRSKSRRWN